MKVWALRIGLRVVLVQQAGKVPIIGVLEGLAPALNQPVREAFRRGLEQLGWAEGPSATRKWRSSWCGRMSALSSWRASR